MGERTLSYQVEEGMDPQEVADVFRQSGILRSIDNLARIARMVK